MTAADDLRDYHADLDRMHGHEPGSHERWWRESIAAIYRTLPYGPLHSPPFDPSSHRRYDREAER